MILIIKNNLKNSIKANLI